MYNNMLFGVKRRIIDEVQDAFNNHPAFTDKITVTNKFPYQQRVQYGVVIRNSSASQIRMSADNYMADLWSHVRLLKVDNCPGHSIEWVREDSAHVTRWVRNEDVSYQLGPTQRRFFTQYPIMAGLGNTKYASSPRQIRVTINDVEVIPEFVDGKSRTVLLTMPTASGDIVKVSYYRRGIADPGIYVIDFTEDNQFYVNPVMIVNNQILVDKTTGYETSVNLHDSVVANSENIYFISNGAPFLLIRDADYTIDYPSGLVTFLIPVPRGDQLAADYRYQPDVSYGPVVVNSYQEIHDAIDGVILSVGRRAKKGDKQMVIVSQTRGQQASIYGGHWEMSISLGVISKDTMQMEEMTDQIVNYLWGVRKNVLEFEGITMNRVEPTGETEETYIDTTGDMYYESSVDISVQTEWQIFQPYVFDIRRILINERLVENLKPVNFEVNLDGSMIYKASPDMSPVITYATMGYERVD